MNYSYEYLGSHSHSHSHSQSRSSRQSFRSVVHRIVSSRLRQVQQENTRKKKANASKNAQAGVARTILRPLCSASENQPSRSSSKLLHPMRCVGIWAAKTAN
jgi:hypothetical protein